MTPEKEPRSINGNSHGLEANFRSLNSKSAFIPHEIITEGGSAVISYAFESFSPRAGKSGVQERSSLQSCATNFFKRFEELQRLALYPYDYSTKKVEEPEAKRTEREPLLDAVSESAIKNWVGGATFRQGLQYFKEGRLTEPRISWNVLSALVREKTDSSESYLARVEFKKARSEHGNAETEKSEPTYHHVSAWCKCLEQEAVIKKRRSVCPHIAALLISWAREPDAFRRASVEDRQRPITKEEEQRQRLSEIARATDRVFTSLETMVSLVLEEGTCSEREVLDMLQLMYSKMRLAAIQIGERWDEEKLSQDINRKEEFETILGLSFIYNVINSRVLAALDIKYKSGMMQIKNAADIAALRKIVENFVEMSAQSEGTVSSSVPVLRNKQDQRKSSHGRSKKMEEDRRAENEVSRSWDKVVGEFASS